MAPRQSTVLRALATERGEATYYTGKPCKRGHDSPRRTHNSDCVACDRESSAEWPRTHREEARAQGRRFLARRPEMVKEYRRRAKLNPKTKERGKRYYRANIERIRVKNREYHKANAEQRHAKMRIWREANRSYIRDTRVRAKYGVEPGEYAAMLAEQKGKCAICSAVFGEGKGKAPHIDHCHATRKVRALLCTKCNTALGLFDDSAPRLREAADYLDRFGSGQ